MAPEEWDQQFDRYLKERFKPFRDKERPADYGRDLSPDPRKGHFSNMLSIEPSPSGDLIAGMTGNGRDREYDIVLISAKDGSVIRNLTSGFDQSMGFEYLATPGRPLELGAVDVVVAAPAIASPTSSAPRRTAR